MSVKKLVSSALFAALIAVCPNANAAIVGFLGSIDSGNPGMLGSLPRDFTLVLDFTPGPSGTSATATFGFPATPNVNTTNMDVNPAFNIATMGTINISNNMMGVDQFTFNGSFGANEIGTNPVFFSFSFTNPTDTIDNNMATPENIEMLVNGQTSISFQGGGGVGAFTTQGVIRGAPEPSTMIALTGLVCGGCGIGYRRRMKRKAAEEAEASEEVEA